jgi:hypothetical protein
MHRRQEWFRCARERLLERLNGFAARRAGIASYLPGCTAALLVRARLHAFCHDRYQIWSKPWLNYSAIQNDPHGPIPNNLYPGTVGLEGGGIEARALGENKNHSKRLFSNKCTSSRYLQMCYH